MFGLLTRAPRRRKAEAPRYARPSLERLEDRLSPSTTPTESLTMQVQFEPNKQVLLTGQLTNAVNPSGDGINIWGAAEGQVLTNSQGYFSVTLTATALGNVYAATADGLSNTASVMLYSAVPTINNFAAIYEGQGIYKFCGSVANAPTSGEVVNFGGIPALQNQSVTVNPDGTFAFFIQIPQGQTGAASAQAVDWWGDTSDTAMAPVT